MPYDQFLREQLAGDLLPNRTEAQLIATGFQRNNMNTHEGGTIPEENLTNYNVDRVKTLGEAVLGLTLGCAQCHDHKFDPITQRDYYQIFAYFNTLSDNGLDGNAGINSRPFYEAKTVLQTGEEPELRKQIEALKQKLANPDPTPTLPRWEAAQRLRLSARGKDFELHPVELLKVSTPNIGKGFDIDPPRLRPHHRPDRPRSPTTSRCACPKLDKPITGLRVIFHPDASAHGRPRLRYRTAASLTSEPAACEPNKRRPQAKGTFVLTTFSASAESVPGDQVNLNRLLDVAASHRRLLARQLPPRKRPRHPQRKRLVARRRRSATAPRPHHRHIRRTDRLRPPHPIMTVQLNFGHGNNLIAAHFEILAMTGADDGSDLPRRHHRHHPTRPQRPPRRHRAECTEQQQNSAHYYAAHADATKRDRIALANLEERLEVVTQKFPTMVMDIAEKPRETHILRRGDYSQPTEKVTAAHARRPAHSPPDRLRRRPTASASPTGSPCPTTRSPPASQ